MYLSCLFYCYFAPKGQGGQSGQISSHLSHQVNGGSCGVIYRSCLILHHTHVTQIRLRTEVVTFQKLIFSSSLSHGHILRSSLFDRWRSCVLVRVFGTLSVQPPPHSILIYLNFNSAVHFFYRKSNLSMCFGIKVLSVFLIIYYHQRPPSKIKAPCYHWVLIHLKEFFNSTTHLAFHMFSSKLDVISNDTPSFCWWPCPL